MGNGLLGESSASVYGVVYTDTMPVCERRIRQGIHRTLLHQCGLRNPYSGSQRHALEAPNPVGTVLFGQELDIADTRREFTRTAFAAAPRPNAANAVPAAEKLPPVRFQNYRMLSILGQVVIHDIGRHGSEVGLAQKSGSIVHDLRHAATKHVAFWRDPCA